MPKSVWLTDQGRFLPPPGYTWLDPDGDDFAIAKKVDQKSQMEAS
jgi:hypothetical protein